MTEENANMQGLVCPIPLSHQGQIIMGHGSGGKMSHDLVSKIFMPIFDNPSLRATDDAGVVTTSLPGRLSISTDSHVVTPLFFPGGDIGRLAICGTVNDVAMVGGTPLWLTAGFILEEGLEIATLEKVVASMCQAAKEAGIIIVAGDTKVVQRGKADGLYINTTGVGLIPDGIEISGTNAQPGDVIILSGPIGNHGIAVLEARQEMGFETNIVSDVAPLNHLVQVMLNASRRIHVLRDPTRGGLATTLCEIAHQSQLGMMIHEAQIPIDPGVAAACEIMGFDPMYIANEGKLVAIVHPEDAQGVLTQMRGACYGEKSVIIGEVITKPASRVLLRTTLGSTRIVDMPSGELLPRIC